MIKWVGDIDEDNWWLPSYLPTASAGELLKKLADNEVTASADLLEVASLFERIMTPAEKTVWAVFVAKQVLPVFEAARPGDRRPRKVIKAIDGWGKKAAAEAFAAAAVAFKCSEGFEKARERNVAERAAHKTYAGRIPSNVDYAYRDNCDVKARELLNAGHAAEAVAYAAENRIAWAVCAAHAASGESYSALLTEGARIIDSRK